MVIHSEAVFIEQIIKVVEITMKFTILDANEIIDYMMEDLADKCKERFKDK